ncbi:MAG: hypothetical protein OXQ29_19190 [Rhodospirillaceae bacterium]|nr:hypothetical protein [Rhodospirillaceae bacterium]
MIRSTPRHCYGPLVVALVGAGMAMAAPVFGQALPGFDPDYKAPRTADGQPDLQGIWSNAILTPLERPAEFADQPFLTEEQAAAYQVRRNEETFRGNRDIPVETDVAHAYNDFWWDWGSEIARTRQTSLIVDPPDGRIPALTPEGEERRAEREAYRRMHPADGPEDRLLRERCIMWSGNGDQGGGPPMLPSAYNNNFHLVQTPDHVLLLKEMVHETRVVPLDGRPPMHDSVRQWLGSSRGHWEGDTLVVETTNFTHKTHFQSTSEHMRLTERFTRVADDVLIYEFTVEDPVTLTRPWTAQIPTVRLDGLIYEFACHETNRGMVGILSGARARERAAAETATQEGADR